MNHYAKRFVDLCLAPKMSVDDVREANEAFLQLQASEDVPHTGLALIKALRHALDAPETKPRKAKRAAPADTDTAQTSIPFGPLRCVVCQALNAQSAPHTCIVCRAPLT